MSLLELYQQTLSSQCEGRISLAQKRPGIFQVLAPFYHEDGDMVELFIENGEQEGTVRISDHGMTVMRLSYEYEIDTQNKEQIFQQIATRNKILEEDGRLYIEVPLDTLYPGLLQMAQGVGKIGSMRYFKREVVKNLFYEMLDEHVMHELDKYRPVKNHLPLPDRDDLEVDYMLEGAHQIFLFGVRGSDKARLATICCLEFQKANLKFSSAIVHEDMRSLAKKDLMRITSAADKQFPSLDDFKAHGSGYLAREFA